MIRIVVLILCLTLAACTSVTTEQTQPQVNVKDKIKVSTTLYPLTYFAERIGGEHVIVTPIIDNGADAHHYEPTISQMKKAADADLFLYVDTSVETFMPKILPNIQSPRIKIVELASEMILPENSNIGESITLESGTLSTESSDKPADEHAADVEDPLLHHHDHEQNHIWLYPPYAITLAELILKQLVALQPDHEALFTSHFQTLKDELLELDRAFSELKNAPKPYFMVTHAAYTTWENYGINQIAISGILGSDEPTQKDLIELINTGRELNLNYLYYEQNIPSANGEVLQTELNLRPTRLFNLATVTSEQLEAGETYFTLMYKNLENLELELYSE